MFSDGSILCSQCLKTIKKEEQKETYEEKEVCVECKKLYSKKKNFRKRIKNANKIARFRKESKMNIPNKSAIPNKIALPIILFVTLVLIIIGLDTVYSNDPISRSSSYSSSYSPSSPSFTVYSMEIKESSWNSDNANINIGIKNNGEFKDNIWIEAVAYRADGEIAGKGEGIFHEGCISNFASGERENITITMDNVSSFEISGVKFYSNEGWFTEKVYIGYVSN